MDRYSDFVARKFQQYGDKFSGESLAAQFIPAFNNGDRFRVLVDFGYEDEKPVWGYVGVTTGWKPVFLLIRRRGQNGSSEILSTGHKILRSKVIR